MQPVKLGIAGLGTVGSGVVNILQKNCLDIERRLGRPIQLQQIAARRVNPNCDTSAYAITDDVLAVARNPEIDIVLELMGGVTTAKEFILTAIAHGKHVVTANKALLAEQGEELFKAANEAGVILAFEAAVAGGIPIIKALREGLAANCIQALAGIINGTGNFILTEMEQGQRPFAEVLKEAQQLGYAEADPTFDVEGIDAAHKLTLLAAIAFGMPIQFKSVFTEGISKVTPVDIRNAAELGYRIKHLGIIRRSAKGIEMRVHPTLIAKEEMLAQVNGVMNAVMVQGDAVGSSLYYGAGAGSLPTASSVLADVIDIARILENPRHHVPPLAFSATEQQALVSMDDVETAYYLRIEVHEKTGVLAHITKILSEHHISIEAIRQQEVHRQSGLVPIIILTQKVLEREMNAAIAKIQALPETGATIARIRLETF